MIKLSENFFLHEFTRSQLAARMGKVLEPPQDIVTNLTRLCEFVLEPIRKELGKPIYILSGWRPLWLNQRVGGAVKSEHVYGRAADFNVVGLRDYDAAVRIAAILPRLPVNQLIFEFPPTGWLHISVCDADATPRRQVITATKRGDRTHYNTGLWRPAP